MPTTSTNALFRRMDSVYSELRYELLVWALKNFQCHHPFALFDSLPPQTLGGGDHLIATNVRNENNSGRQQIEP